MLPRVIAPGFNLIVAQPGADRAGREALNNLLFPGHLRQLLPRPALPGLAVLSRRTTGQRYYLGALQRRENAPRAHARRIAPTVCLLPPLPPALDCGHTTPQPLGDGGIRPVGMTGRKQHDLRPLHDGERCHVTGTEVHQPHLLLGRQCDRILGSRAWHLESPPTLAKVMKAVVCQAFSHCKPAPYFVRYVLSFYILHAPQRSSAGHLGRN